MIMMMILMMIMMMILLLIMMMIIIIILIVTYNGVGSNVSLSQAMLVGVMLVGRLGVRKRPPS